MTELLQLSQVHRGFSLEGQRIEVLRGIDFSMSAGEMVALTGASGAGKSTLLHLMGSLDQPESGSLLFEGNELMGLKNVDLALHRNRHLGFVFQFHHLITELSAVENVALPARVGGLEPKQALNRAEELLVWVGLEDRLRHRPSELSGGEQQRVALARGLVMEPRLLLADEPTGNLDEENAGAIHDLFASLNEERGVAMIVATHSSALARRMQRRVHLVDGVLVNTQGTDTLDPTEVVAREDGA